MGFWDNFAGGLGGAIGGIGSGIINGLFGRQTQNLQNRWQSSENEKNRQFQADEALKAREWQEDFYEMYQSPEAQITSQMAGYKANGINPALMFGGSSPSGGSVPSTSTPMGNASGGSSTGSNIVGSLTNDIETGMQVAENLMTQKDRFAALAAEAKTRQAEAVIADMDSGFHEAYKEEIGNIFRNDLDKQLQIIQDEKDISSYKVKEARADSQIKQIERDQANFENQFLSQKLKDGKTVFQHRLENELRRDMNETAISNLETKYAKYLKELELQLTREKLSQEQSQTIIDKWRSDFIKEHDFDPFGNNTTQSIMSALFAGDNEMQEIFDSGSFDALCDKVDEESGFSGWDVLTCVLYLIPLGKLASILKSSPKLVNAGKSIFGKVWPKIVQSADKMSRQRKAIKRVKNLNKRAAKSAGIDYDIDYDDLSNFM